MPQFGISAAHLLAGVAAIAALKLGEGFFAPILVAIFASLALAPPVRWLSSIMPRAWASAIVVLGLVGALLLTGYSLSDEATAFSRRLPGLIREVRSALQAASSSRGPIRQIQQAISELERTAAPDTGDATPVTIVDPVDVRREMMAGAATTAAWAAQGILVCFFIYFLLAAGDTVKGKLVTISGDRLSAKRVTVQMIDEMIQKMARFVFYQVWSGALVGLVTWVAFWSLGMRYASLWGIAAGLLNCVPYFGPTVILVMSGFAALLQFHSIPMALGVAAISVAVTSLEGLLLAPVVLGKASQANSVAVFVSLMFWGWLWGPIGLVIAVPVLMMFKTIADHVESLHTVSLLLSE